MRLDSSQQVKASQHKKADNSQGKAKTSESHSAATYSKGHKNDAQNSLNLNIALNDDIFDKETKYDPIYNVEEAQKRWKAFFANRSILS